jgi:hypothetical protein
MDQPAAYIGSGIITTGAMASTRDREQGTGQVSARPDPRIAQEAFM